MMEAEPDEPMSGMNEGGGRREGRRGADLSIADTAAAGLTAMSAPSPAAAAASPAPSSTGSAGPRPYVPQFSAATQMILSRISSKPGSLSAALSSASSVARGIEKSTFEDAKRRLVMNMNTSLTMPMPMPMPSSKPRQSSSIGSSFRLPTPSTPSATAAAITPAGARTVSLKPGPKPGTPKSLSAKQKAKVPRGTKRKRVKGAQDASSSLSELSDSSTEIATKAQKAATMTKSGRQVQKPTQFNPADATSSQKRKHYGKRTVEQALCKVCTRGLSPNMNQIVFCDGCNFCWHQMCHDPYIDDDFVSDESRSWLCGRCMSKREKALSKKKTVVEHKGISWASKNADQRRKYLTDIPHAQLVNIIMYSTELHPDLPIFPVQEPGSSTKRSVQGSAAASTASAALARAELKSNGPTNFNSTVSTPDTKASDAGGKSGAKRKGSTEAQGQAERESSVESIPPAWPKVGQGVLAGLEMKEEDLRDKNDFEAFSVTSYDSKGRKVTENGMAV